MQTAKPNETKTCSRCLVVKLATEFRRRLICNECTNKRTREWQKANPEKAKEQRRIWRQANTKKLRADNRIWIKANLEKHREKRRIWRQANPEKLSENNRIWRQANPEKLSEKRLIWTKANREKLREQGRQKIAKLSDGYVAKTLKLSMADTTPELIQQKREHIEIYRLLRDLNKQIKEMT